MALKTIDYAILLSGFGLVIAVVLLGATVIIFPGYAGYAPDKIDRSAGSTNDLFSQSTPDDVEDLFIGYLNEERSAEGVQTVSQNDQLTDLANRHAEDMAARQNLTYIDSKGRDTTGRYREAGLLPTCELQVGPNTAYQGLELVLQVPSGVVNADGGKYRIINANDLAFYINDQWMDNDRTKELAMIHTARSVGLGYSAAENGDVYVALAFC